MRLLTPGDVRELAGRLGVRPSKRLGQNFVVEPGTVRRIAALAALRPEDVVLEVGPGLGSLTLALLEAGAGRVVGVEIDPLLAGELPRTVATRAPGLADRVAVVAADALHVDDRDLPASPSVLVANLPYNVAVPVLLHLLAVLPSLRRGLVMVQAEVADRMCAAPGSRVYGAPSVKLAWFAAARPAGPVPRSVYRPGRCRAACSGRCRTWIPGWSPLPGRIRRTPRRPARRCSGSSTRHSGSGARRCGPRSPAGPAPRRKPSACSGRPASTRAHAGNPSASQSSPGWRRRVSQHRQRHRVRFRSS